MQAETSAGGVDGAAGASFRGGVFSKRFEAGREGANLVPGPRGLVAWTTSGVELFWPWDACTVELGGSSGRMVFVRAADGDDTAFTEEKGFLEALEAAAGSALAEQLDAAKEGAHSRRARNLRAGLVALAVVAVLVLAGVWGLGKAAAATVDSLPIAIDQKLGALAAPMITQTGELVDDPVLVEAIESMVARLEPHAAVEGFSFDVHVVRSDVVNAFALPGGDIAVMTGLLEAAETPEQVAGVVAHELAHVTLRHGLKRVVRAAGATLALTIFLGDVEGIAAAAAGYVNQATMLGHSRAQETEADEEGARMLHAAGIDPVGLAEFFQLLERETGGGPALATWLSTHPAHDARTEAVRAQAEAFGTAEYEPLDAEWPFTWDEVRERAGRAP